MDSNIAGRTVTYGMLKRALSRLGLIEIMAPGYLIYEDKDRDAIIVLPTVPDSDPVRPVHFSTAQWTVVQKGIADEATFEKLLVPTAPRSKARTRSTDAPPATRRLARRRPTAAMKPAEAN